MCHCVCARLFIYACICALTMQMRNRILLILFQVASLWCIHVNVHKNAVSSIFLAFICFVYWNAFSGIVLMCSALCVVHYTQRSLPMQTFHSSHTVSNRVNYCWLSRLFRLSFRRKGISIAMFSLSHRKNNNNKNNQSVYIRFVLSFLAHLITPAANNLDFYF